MKKTVLILLAVVVALSTLGTCFAGDSLEAQLTALENVRDCKVLCFREFCFVALRTQGVVTKTAQNALVDTVTAIIQTSSPHIRRVFVSTSVKTFAALDKLTEENIWEQLTKLFNLDSNQYPMPAPLPIPFDPDLGDDQESAYKGLRTGY